MPAQLSCSYCKEDTYRASNHSIFFIDMVKNDSYKTIICDESCFIHHISRELTYDFIYIAGKNSFEKKCYQCGEFINHKTNKDNEPYVLIDQRPVRVHGQASPTLPTIGYVRFCVECWTSMAGPNFFDSCSEIYYSKA